MQEPLKLCVSCALLWICLIWLGGCAGLDLGVPVGPLVLTASQQESLGAAVQKRLLQMLGGPYHDASLSSDLQRLGQRHKLSLSIADRSVVEMYPLPGRTVVVTRGLLMQLENGHQLDRLLEKAVSLSTNASVETQNRTMTRAISAFLAEARSVYDPDASDIRLARIFAGRPCRGTCLDSVVAASGDRREEWPESFTKLEALQPGYDLLAKGGRLEQAGRQSEAVLAYLQAASECPGEPGILGVLGMAYLRADQPQTARLPLQQAVSLQPDYYKTRMGLGFLSLQHGNSSQAMTHLAESVRLLPVTENLFLLAEASEKGGDPDSASALYELVAASDPDSKLGRTASTRLNNLKDRQ